MAESFDIFKDPFVTWRRTDGTSDRFGLKSLLARAHELTPFSDHGPQTTFAVIRVLLVLMHQTRPTCDDAEWRRVWDAGRFPDDWLRDIEKAADGKFDLFDPKRPFFQRTSASADDGEKDKPASYLQSHFAAATGINHASHTYDDRVALCPACCACGLLELPPFCGAGGSGLKTSINGTVPVYFLPVGPSLFHTLLLNWPLRDRVPGDHPQWEPGKPPKQIGILEGFTWEPRTVRLFPMPADGRLCTNCGSAPPVVVRRMVFSKGDDATKERLREWRDPHVGYEDIAVGRKTQIRSLIAPDPGKRPAAALGFWRNAIAALLRMSTPAADGLGCRAVAAGRSRGAGKDLIVSCVVPFTRPGQDKKHLVRGEQWALPPLDPDQVKFLLGELTWIEEALTKWARRVEVEENPVPGIMPLAEFERRVEGHFRALLARKGEQPEKWREAVRKDVEELTRPERLPGRALDVARTQQAIEKAIDAAFPP